MKKNKANKTYLKIPENFNGFSYKELETRLAVMELKRDMMRQRLTTAIDSIRGKKTGKKHSDNSSASSLMNIFANSYKVSSAISSRNIGTIITLATMGYKAYSFFKGKKDKRKAKKAAKY